MRLRTHKHTSQREKARTDVEEFKMQKGTGTPPTHTHPPTLAYTHTHPVPHLSASPPLPPSTITKPVYTLTHT